MSFLFHVSDSTPAGIGGIDEYTVLMTHFDGDQSDSQHVVTHNGDAQFSTTESKFGGSSMLFDGTGDYLTAPDSDDWGFGSGDFSIDCWVRPTVITGGTQQIIAQCDSAASLGSISFTMAIPFTAKIQAGICQGGTFYWIDSTNIVAINNWYHIAFIRDGDTLRLFINGVDEGTLDITGITANNSSNLLAVGRCGEYNGNYFNGYIDEVRITKGEARWTTGFTPPTSAYTSDANTKLLLHMDGDVSDGSHIVTSNGNPQLDAATTKFDGSMNFDGTGDYLSIPDSADWDFGTGDFTIDFWINCGSQSVNGYLFDRTTAGESFNNFAMQILSANGHLRFLVDDGTDTAYSVLLEGSDVVTDNGWHHVALVRSSGTTKFYVDGQEDATTSTAYDINLTKPFFIAGTEQAGGFLYEGYIDELRISKGIARWTANFTPESGPYTT